jgi:AcrR family transcriptional regulator
MRARPHTRGSTSIRSSKNVIRRNAAVPHESFGSLLERSDELSKAAVRKSSDSADRARNAAAPKLDPNCVARREEILAAATELFAEHGYSDAVTQMLAERVQVGKGTLYRHFPSKRELFLAAADRVMRKLRERLDAAVEEVDDALDRLMRGLVAFLAFFDENPRYAELLIQERALFKDRQTPTYLEHREANVVPWRDRFRALIADGRVRDVPVERITDVINDLAYGTVFTNYFSNQHKPFETQARDILDIVLFGILSDSERKRFGGEITHLERTEAAT